LKYIDRKLEVNSGVREIYSIDQLNSYMVNCERKIRSENKLNILPNKDFMIHDDEEENDFFIEFDKNFGIEVDDDDEVTDFLNFQMKKKKAPRDDKRKDQEATEEEANDEYLKDYYPIPFNSPGYEKRLALLMDTIDQTQLHK